jgi:hypothetical protein
MMGFIDLLLATATVMGIIVVTYGIIILELEKKRDD